MSNAIATPAKRVLQEAALRGVEHALETRVQLQGSGFSAWKPYSNESPSRVPPSGAWSALVYSQGEYR